MANSMAWSTLTRKGMRPLALEFRSSTSLILLMVSFAVFTDIFPYAVVVPVLPFALTTRAGVPEDKVQFWISIALAAFGAAIFVSAPIWGFLADRTRDRRTPMLVGLILLAASTFLLCFMNGIPMLLIGRIFQGLTSSLTWSVGLALVTDTVPSDNLGRAMGWVGIAVSLGTLSSPLLGGVVYGKGGYYQVWAMCFALVAGDIILRLVIIEKKHAVKWQQHNDATQPPNKASSHELAKRDGECKVGEDKAEQSPEPPAEPNAEQMNPDPEVDAAPQPDHLSLKSVMILFTSTRLLSALWGTAIEGALLTALDSTVPLEVKRIFGWDSIGAGLIFLPLLLPTFLGPVVGIMSDRYGPRWLSTTGFLITVPFLICMRFVTENSMSHKIMLCGMMAGTGLGVTLCFGPLTAEISWAVEEGYKGPGTKPIALAYGLYNVAFSLGTIIGPLLGGFIRDSKGWGTESWSLAILSFVTAITCALWAGGPPLWKMKAKSQTLTQ